MRHRLFKLFNKFFQSLLSVVVRAVITTVVFGACVVGLAHYMGVPLPSADEVLKEFEISRLAKVLS